MKKLALALAAAAALGLAVPAFTTNAAQAQESVKVKVRTGHHQGARAKFVVRHDRGLHRGWSHSRHYGAARHVTIVKKHRGGGVVVKKRISG